MRVEHILSVLLLAGCDVVFRIDKLGDPVEQDRDATVDPDSPVGCEQATSHDEDDDGVPDACDLCPGTADDQTDTDNDGVGDACDPSGTTNDRIALFVSFAEPGAKDAWTVASGSWSFDGEDLLHTSPSTTNHGVLEYKNAVSGPPFVLEVRFTVVSFPMQGGVFAVVTDADTQHRGVQCALIRYDGNPTRDAVRADYIPTMDADETNLASVGPGTYRLAMSYEQQGPLRCTFDSTGTMVDLPTVTLTGKLAFRILSMATKVHHLAIYARE